jgi:S1-C subfamily serine protease
VAGIGLGLAVPINATTQRIISALTTFGRVRRAWLGVAGAEQPLPPQLVQRVGRRTGLRVLEVVANSPAATAGLRTGDVVLSAGGREIATATQLQKLMVEEAIGVPIEITVWRNSALVDVIATPHELDAA